MTQLNTGQTKHNLSWIPWVMMLILMTATGIHLLRSALKADETKAILIGLMIFALCLAFRVGKITATAPNSNFRRARKYIPLSIIPIILLAIWAANVRLFGAFDISAVLFHLDHSLAYDGMRDDIIEFSVYLIFGLILIACLSYLAKRDRRMAIIERICAIILLLVNPITAYTYDSLLNPERNALNLIDAYHPVQLSGEPAAPKNLILIYLESMEATYSEPAFGDVFEDLNILSTKGLRINGVKQIQDTGWTMAGLVASQCGVPLLSYGLIMINRMKNIDSFLPNAQCLASQLSGQGYQTRFYGGASLRFAGKGKFLETHGYQKSFGLNEMPKVEYEDVGEWGLYDDRLYELALKELESLSNRDAPYLLSILTLGAHPPNGYPAPICFKMFKDADQMDRSLLSVACTARLTRNFLRAAQTRGFLDNTVIVLMSDHLSQKNTQTRQLNQYERENFLLLLGLDKDIREITKHSAMIDVYPTILDSLGLSPEKGKAGLGVSLLSLNPSLLEQHGEPKLNLAIRSDKQLREKLWELSKTPK